MPIFLLLILFVLASCANSPTPEVSKSETPEQSSSGLTPEASGPLGVDSVPKQELSFRSLHRSIDSAIFAKDSTLAVMLLKQQIQSANNLDEVGKRSIQLAVLFHQLGREKEAQEVIEGFIAYKPAVLDWLDSADRLDRAWRGEMVEQIQDVQPLVKQISNHLATSGDYGLMRELTDSLRSIRIPDSLRKWSLQQDSLALKRTVARLMPQIDSMRNWVKDKGDYQRAKALLANLRRLRPELLQILAVDSLEIWIERNLEKEKQTQDPNFWQKNDPKKVLEEARKSSKGGNWEKSIALYRQLLATTLRTQAVPELQSLGELFCQKKRQVAAEKFALSRKDQGEGGSVHIQSAISVLHSCLEEFPDYSANAKVKQNIEMLQKEWERRNP